MVTSSLAAGAASGAALSWNIGEDIRQLLALHFMVNAFRAGTIVAVVAGAIGWFMVLRRQSFAGHTLAVVSFPGASGAILLGISATAGYFAASIASLYGGFLNSLTGLLFGTFLGISDGQVTTLLIAAAAALAVLAGIARPLFFATVDPDVARARGVPARLVSTVFLLLLGCAAAEVSQITGALLVFALLVMPAAAAQQLTARPGLSFVITIALGLAIAWLGLAVAYFSVYPVGFYVTTFGFTAYVASAIIRAAAARLARGRGLRQAVAA